MHDSSALCQNALPVTLIHGMVSSIGYGAGKTENKCRWVTMTNRASDTAMTLDTIVARLNIEHYRKKLSTDTDETTLRTLLHLVAEEKAKSPTTKSTSRSTSGWRPALLRITLAKRGCAVR
jgi:hypothetical protein